MLCDVCVSNLYMCVFVPQVSVTAAAVAAGGRGWKSPKVLQGGRDPDFILLNGTTLCVCVCVCVSVCVRAC